MFRYFRISAFLFVFGSGLIVSLSANAFSLGRDALPPSPMWQSGSLQFGTQGYYFLSDANYTNVGGEFEKLQGGEDIAALGLQVYGKYAFNSSLAVYGFGNAGRIAVTSTNNTETNFTLDGVGGGLYYTLWKKVVRLMLHVKFQFTLDGVESSRTDPLTSDGVTYLLPELYAFKKMGNFIGYLNIGARFPDEGLAKNFFYGIGGAFTFNRFMAGLALRGSTLLVEDEFSATPTQRTVVTDRVNGTSLVYYAPDPQGMDVTFWGSMNLTPDLSLALGYGLTIDGKNSAEGNAILFGLNFSFGGKKSGFRPRARKRTKEKFRIKREKVDRDIIEVPRRKRKRVNDDVEYGDDGEPIKRTEDLLEDRIRGK